MRRRIHKRGLKMRGNQPLSSHSRQSIGWSVCGDHVSMPTGCVIRGRLPSLQTSTGLSQKAIEESLELVFLHDISMKEMDIDMTVDDILDAYVCSYAEAMGNVYVEWNNNARPITARIVEAYLEQETIQRIQWLARPPDLYPAGHVSDALG
ncbi:hypothetical protein TNCV_3820281 [Trichonephila clavipes]|uniref:Uncharacterized protein n=1 Tax=Trichonephila clavipes TaxID=2585209 RepID=A0A8X6UTP4_TRICX|nr:hypothetical protein TNCV_3820281 [Trichonephila clavipes]